MLHDLLIAGVTAEASVKKSEHAAEIVDHMWDVFFFRQMPQTFRQINCQFGQCLVYTYL
jgi:hypothetical protein